MSTKARALLLDLSGVLYEGSTVIDGAIDTVNSARRRGLILRFVTNTATKSSTTILQDLRRMQIDIHDDELYTAPIAARAYIEQNQLYPYYLIHQAIRDEFDPVSAQQPNAVVLGDARDDLNYATLNQAFQHCLAGAPLIAIGMNKYFKDDEGIKLDAGPFVKAIEWAADTQAIVMGKPSVDFFKQVVASTGVPANECLMVGDDVIADVKGAVDAGLQGCLVQTGKYQAGDEAKLPASARMIASIADLFEPD